MIEVKLLQEDHAELLAQAAIDSNIKAESYKVGVWANFDHQQMTEFFLEKSAINKTGNKEFKRSYVVCKDKVPIGEFVLMNYQWYPDCPLENECKISAWLTAPCRDQGIISLASEKLFILVKPEIESIGAVTVIDNKRVIYMLKKMNWEDLGDFWMPGVSTKTGWHHFHGFRKDL